MRSSGKESEHPKFGPQIEVEECRIKQPTDAQGVERYLASGLIKGVGPVLAGRIVETLGTGALEIILDKPQAPGRGARAWGPSGPRSSPRRWLITGPCATSWCFCNPTAWPGTALRIFRRYGAGALGVVQNKPHRLASDVRGIGFATADAIAARLGIAADHPERLQAGLLWILTKARDEGHVYLPYDELLDRTAAELRVERSLLGPAFARCTLTRRSWPRTCPRRSGRCTSTGQHAMEMLAAKELARISRQEGPAQPAKRAAKAVAWASGQLAVKPSRSQAKRPGGFAGSRAWGVLTGGPGTGKTTLVKAVITIARRMGL